MLWNKLEQLFADVFGRTPRIYRRRHTATAVQFDPTYEPWPGGVRVLTLSGPTPTYLIGHTPIKPGDWIVTEGAEKSLYTDRRFRALFEEV